VEGGSVKAITRTASAVKKQSFNNCQRKLA
jgi:hypothetical protein